MLLIVLAEIGIKGWCLCYILVLVQSVMGTAGQVGRFWWSHWWWWQLSEQSPSHGCCWVIFFTLETGEKWPRMQWKLSSFPSCIPTRVCTHQGLQDLFPLLSSGHFRLSVPQQEFETRWSGGWGEIGHSRDYWSCRVGLTFCSSSCFPPRGLWLLFLAGSEKGGTNFSEVRAAIREEPVKAKWSGEGW